MSLFVLDTDTFSLYQRMQPRVVFNLVRHLSDSVALTVITVEEQVAGWQRVIRQSKTDRDKAVGYERLAASVETMSGWPIMPLSAAALARFDVLARRRLNVGANDLRIAAIALESGAIVVTRNLRDFRRLPGLVCEDWSV